MTGTERLTTAEQGELRQLCTEGRTVVAWIRQGHTHITNGFAFTRLFERFIELAEKSAGFNDPLKFGEFTMMKGD